VLLVDVKGASVTIEGVVSLSLVVVVVVVVVVVEVGGAADVVVVVVVVVGSWVELVLTKVVASGVGLVVSLLGRTEVEVGVELDEVEEVEKSVLVELGLAVDGTSVACSVNVCDGVLSVVGSVLGLSLLDELGTVIGFSLLEEPALPMISEEMGILTTKGSSSFRPLLLLLLSGLPVLLCLST